LEDNKSKLRIQQIQLNLVNDGCTKHETFENCEFIKDNLSAFKCQRYKMTKNQAESKYRHSLTFRIRCSVVTATKPVHRL